MHNGSVSHAHWILYKQIKSDFLTTVCATKHDNE